MTRSTLYFVLITVAAGVFTLFGAPHIGAKCVVASFIGTVLWAGIGRVAILEDRRQVRKNRVDVRRVR